MRDNGQRFLNMAQSYLKGFFTEKARELGIEDIKSWQIDYPGTLNTASEYPCCMLLLPERRLSDVYTTSFTLFVGIGIKETDTQLCMGLGAKWTDILEDAIRSDWHLGNACLDVVGEPSIDTEIVSGAYLISLVLECEVDLGGFVYEDKSESSSEEVLQAVRLQDQRSDGDDLPQMRKDSR